MSNLKREIKDSFGKEIQDQDPDSLESIVSSLGEDLKNFDTASEKKGFPLRGTNKALNLSTLKIGVKKNIGYYIKQCVKYS